MNQSFLQFRTRDGVCDAYLTAASNGKNLPGIILYMNAIGLRPRICAMADRIAEQGYVVLAPNLFYRSGPAPLFDYENLLKPENFANLFPLFRPMIQNLSPELAQRDSATFLKLLREQPAINPHRIGALGYCMGGGQALRTAGNFPNDIQAAASFHAGGLVTELPTSPHLWFPKIKAEVYIAHADQDASMPPEQMVRVSAELARASVGFKAEVYERCLHGWTMSDIPAHSPVGEQRHWQNVFSFFEQLLKC